MKEIKGDKKKRKEEDIYIQKYKKILFMFYYTIYFDFNI
jgi:hypothetical protein